MVRIEFSELTNRLRRNLMAATFLIIAITGFNIRVGKVTASGFQLENLTTEVILVILIAVVIYHAIAFGIHAFEEYRDWELTRFDKTKNLLDFFDEIQSLISTLEIKIKDYGAIDAQNQTILTENDVKRLERVAELMLTYGKRLKRLPVISRVRFWGLDIGVAGLATGAACVIGFGWIDPGFLSHYVIIPATPT